MDWTVLATVTLHHQVEKSYSGDWQQVIVNCDATLCSLVFPRAHEEINDNERY